MRVLLNTKGLALLAGLLAATGSVATANNEYVGTMSPVQCNQEQILNCPGNEPTLLETLEEINLWVDENHYQFPSQ